MFIKSRRLLNFNHKMIGGRKTRKHKRSKKSSQKAGKLDGTKKIMEIDGAKLGWSPSVITKNLNKLLINAHKKGIKKIIIIHWGERNDIYSVEKEIKKRKLKIRN